MRRAIAAVSRRCTRLLITGTDAAPCDRAKRGTSTTEAIVRAPGLAMVAILILTATALVPATTHAQGWRPGPPMRAARWAHAVIELRSGRLLAMGGVPDPSAVQSGSPIHSARAETLDATWMAWTEISPMPAEHRWQQQALLLATGRVMVVGEHPAGSLPEAHFFDEGNGSWSSSANSPERRRFAAELVALDADRVLYLGGYDGASGGEAFASAEIYRISTNLWQATGSMAQARFGLRAVQLTTGPLADKVLACGGLVYGSGGLETRTSCEVYDPARGLWSAGPAMAEGRSFFTLTKLADGRLLAVGGRQSGSSNLATSEIFDPQTLTWQPTGTMALGRARQTATLLPSGRVLLAGGSTVDGGNPTATTAYFDPAQGTWAIGPSMSAERSDHGMVLKSDGRVIVIGGRGSDGQAMAATEILDLGPDREGPVAATVTAVAMPTKVPSATATVVPTMVPASTSTRGPTADAPAASPIPSSAAKVCPQLRGKAPDSVIATAMADPARVMGYRLAVDPSKPVSAWNPERTWLSLHDYGKPYERLSNGVEFKGGCP